jgi:hypothetical protein
MRTSAAKTSAGKLAAMSRTPEEVYLQLGTLMAELPDLAAEPTTPEAKAWLRRAAELVQSTAGLADSIQFKLAIENLDGLLRARHARTIATIVQRALTKAELEVPSESRGAFVTASNAFDVFAAVRRVLNTAEADVLLVDPHADATVLTDYAVLAPDNVSVRLLTGWLEHKANLNSAAQNWQHRFGDVRPLSIRLAAAERLPDRLILVDSVTAWALGASFADLAKDKRTTLMRIPSEAAEARVADYAAIWEAAEPLQSE